jgi:arylsulfatase A-like enzyme/Flp pilus assembly protein TadD
VLGLGLLAAAGGVAVYGYVPGLLARKSFVPRAISISPELRPVPAVPAGPGELQGSNLLLVTFDTTRADRIGCYGNRDVETPAFDRLAREGVLFSDVTTPSPTTLPSHCSIMTGLYPYRHGARANNTFHLAESNRTLAEVLAGEGFATGAFVSAFVLDNQFGLDQGFREYDDRIEQKHETLLDCAERRGDETNRLAERWLRDHASGRFFLWVHYFDPHSPYEAPEPFKDRYPLTYDCEVAFADSQLGTLLGVLDELGLADRTLVVAAGDHGEGLGQHNEPAHSTLIYQSTMHVPLVMRCGKRLGGGVQVNRTASLVDVMPTVLGLLGIAGPEGMDGHDLAKPPTEPRTIFLETLQGQADYGWAALLGARQGPLKYIYGPDAELYDLAADPFERRNLSSARAESATALRQQLAGFFGGDLEKAASAAPTHQLTSADVARLRSLGYLSGGGEAPAAGPRPHPRDMIPLQNEVNAALSLEREQGLGAVIARLQEIADRHPDLVSAHIYLAAALQQKGELARAEASYARLLELRPGDVSTLMLLAHLKVAQRKPDDAAVLLEQVIDLAPGHFEALDQLGRMRLAQGRFDEAVDLLTRALDVRPREESLPDAIASAMLSMDRADDAVSLFTRMLVDDPGLSMVRNTLAGILRDAGRTDEAVALLTQGVELAPQDYLLANNLAFIIATTPGDAYRPMQAVLMMERVCRETGYQDPRYLHTLSLVYATRLRLDEAIAMAEKARSIASASDDPRFSALAPAIGQSLQRYKALKEQGFMPTSPQNAPRPAPEDGAPPPPGEGGDPP